MNVHERTIRLLNTPLTTQVYQEMKQLLKWQPNNKTLHRQGKKINLTSMRMNREYKLIPIRMTKIQNPDNTDY